MLSRSLAVSSSGVSPRAFAQWSQFERRPAGLLMTDLGLGLRPFHSSRSVQQLLRFANHDSHFRAASPASILGALVGFLARADLDAPASTEAAGGPTKSISRS